MSTEKDNEIDYTNVKKFKMAIRRLTMQESPLAPGGIAVVFDEDPEGEPFSVLVEKIFESEKLSDVAFKNDVLQLKYWLNVNICSEANEESVQDLRYGLKILDDASRAFRVEAATDTKLKIQEEARRVAANVHVSGCFFMKNYINEFDTCCLDTSGCTFEDIENGIVNIMDVAQRVQPTVYVVSAEFANRLSGSEFVKTNSGRIYTAHLKQKSVFAKPEGLENIFVRTLYK